MHSYNQYCNVLQCRVRQIHATPHLAVQAVNVVKSMDMLYVLVHLVISAVLRHVDLNALQAPNVR